MFQYGKLFRSCRWLHHRLYGKQTIHSTNHLPLKAVYVTHHQNMYGPITAMAWTPFPLRIWTLHVFLDKTLAYRQFSEYTFQQRLGWGKKRSKTAAKIIAPFIAALLNSAGAIPVYRGKRSIFETINLSVAALCRGESILISPDVDYADDTSEVKEIYLGFLNLEKYYFRETGEHIPFIPLYCNRSQKTIYIGEPVSFSDGASFGQERQRVAENLRVQLNTFGKN